VLDPVLRKDREMLDQNSVSDAVLNMYDIRDALSAAAKNKRLGDPDTDYTIGDCIDDVILFLESLEERIEK
jgi:hypothetical protein